MFRDDDRAPTHSQFAFRVSMMGAFAALLFAVIFFRLWFVEVLSGEEYLKEANANRVRELPIPAPRGRILDDNGHTLVGNRTILALQVQPDKLPRRNAERNKELRKLADLSGLKLDKIKTEIREQVKLLPASPVTLQQNVDPDLVLYLREHQDELPGITSERISVRDYPEGNLGSQLFGYVSEVNADQLKEPAYADLKPGDRVGATGLESQYDNILRGRSGAIRVQVDATGRPSGPEQSRIEPETGDNLVLTLDEKVQKAGEAALATYGGSNPGAFVAMNIDDGSILGMGSAPDYDPNVYTPPVSTKAIKALNDDESKPLLNRAIQSGYPTGSTFKLITATAGLEEGLITPTEIVDDPGCYQLTEVDEFCNAGKAVNGPINMTDALRVSSDVYFYKLGNELDAGGGLQKWASNYGFGSLTGIDLPGEQSGLLPTPEWRDQLYDQAADPDSPCGTQRVYDPARDCFETDRKWSVGDNVNLSVGQGDLSATPLQLAVAYAALGNGGDVVRPHLADHAEDAEGQLTQEIQPAPQRQINLDPTVRSTIMEGLREAAMEPGGTSYPVFGGFPVEIAGKTGTAEKGDLPDQSWYAALAPADDPEYVVVTTIENGGFGAETAAPAARDILSQLLDIHGSDINTVGGDIAAD
jgi:penicillin-binding protein 2